VARLDDYLYTSLVPRVDWDGASHGVPARDATCIATSLCNPEAQPAVPIGPHIRPAWTRPARDASAHSSLLGSCSYYRSGTCRPSGCPKIGSALLQHRVIQSAHLHVGERGCCSLANMAHELCMPLCTTKPVLESSLAPACVGAGSRLLGLELSSSVLGRLGLREGRVPGSEWLLGTPAAL
jgi:hypothetical protein